MKFSHGKQDTVRKVVHFLIYSSSVFLNNNLRRIEKRMHAIFMNCMIDWNISISSETNRNVMLIESILKNNNQNRISNKYLSECSLNVSCSSKALTTTIIKIFVTKIFTLCRKMASIVLADYSVSRSYVSVFLKM